MRYNYINGAPPLLHLAVLTLFFDFLPSLQNRYQAFVFDLVESRKFEMFIILVITINMIVMMVQHYDQSEEVTFVLDILQILAIVISPVNHQNQDHVRFSACH